MRPHKVFTILVLLLLVVMNVSFSNQLENQIKKVEEKNKKDPDFVEFLNKNKEFLNYLQKNGYMMDKIDLYSLGYISEEGMNSNYINIKINLTGDNIKINLLPSQIDEDLIVQNRFFYPNFYNMYVKLDPNFLMKTVEFTIHAIFSFSLPYLMTIFKKVSDLPALKYFEFQVNPYTVKLLTQNMNQTFLLPEPYTASFFDLKIPKEDWNKTDTPWGFYKKIFTIIKNHDYTLIRKVSYFNPMNLENSVNQLNKYTNIFEGNFISGGEATRDVDKNLKIIAQYINNQGSSSVKVENEKIIKYKEILTKTAKLLHKIHQEAQELNGKNAWDQKEKIKELSQDLDTLTGYLSTLETLKGIVDSTITQIKKDPRYSDLFSLSDMYPYLTQYIIDGKFSTEAPLDLVISDLANFIVYINGGKIEKESVDKKIEFLCNLYKIRKNIISNLPPDSITKELSKENTLSKLATFMHLFKPSITLQEYKDTLDYQYIGDGISLNKILPNNREIEKICKKREHLVTDLTKLRKSIEEMNLNLNKQYNSIFSETYYGKLTPLISNVSKKLKVLDEICNNGNEPFCSELKTFEEKWSHTLFPLWEKYHNIPLNVNTYQNKYILKSEISGRFLLSNLFLERLDNILDDYIEKVANEKLVIFKIKNDHLDPVLIKVTPETSQIEHTYYSITYEVKPLIKAKVENGEYLGTSACTELKLPLNTLSAHIKKTDLNIKQITPVNEKIYKICFNSLERNKTYYLTFEWKNYPIINIENENKNYVTQVSSETVTMENRLYSLKVNPYFQDKVVSLVFLYSPDYTIEKIKKNYQENMKLKNIFKQPLVKIEKSRNLTEGKLYKYTIIEKYKIIPLEEQTINVSLTFQENVSSFDKIDAYKNSEPIKVNVQKNKVILKDSFVTKDKSPIVYTIKIYFQDKERLKEYLEKKLEEYKKKKIKDFSSIKIRKIRESLENLEKRYEREINIAESLLKKELNDETVNSILSIFDTLDQIYKSIKNILEDYTQLKVKYEKIKDFCDTLKSITNDDQSFKINININKTTLVIDTEDLYSKVVESQNKICNYLNDINKLKDTNVDELITKTKLEIDRKKSEVVQQLNQVLSEILKIERDPCIESLPKLAALLEETKKYIKNFALDGSLESLKELRNLKRNLKILNSNIKDFRNLCKVKVLSSLNNKIKKINNILKELEQNISSLKVTEDAYQKCMDLADEETCNLRKESIEKYMKKITDKIIYIKNQLKLLQNTQNPPLEKIEELKKLAGNTKNEYLKLVNTLSKIPPTNDVSKVYLEKGQLGNYYITNVQESSSSGGIGTILLISLGLLTILGVGLYYLYSQGYLDNYLGNKKEEDEEEEEDLFDIKDSNDGSPDFKSVQLPPSNPTTKTTNERNTPIEEETNKESLKNEELLLPGLLKNKEEESNKEEPREEPKDNIINTNTSEEVKDNNKIHSRKSDISNDNVSLDDLF